MRQRRKSLVPITTPKPFARITQSNIDRSQLVVGVLARVCSASHVQVNIPPKPSFEPTGSLETTGNHLVAVKIPLEVPHPIRRNHNLNPVMTLIGVITRTTFRHQGMVFSPKTMLSDGLRVHENSRMGMGRELLVSRLCS